MRLANRTNRFQKGEGKLMQQLRFHPKWDRTISTKDREYIKQTFDSIKTTGKDGVSFPFLWQAINHKQDLLVTVLIHNCTPEVIAFKQKRLQYKKEAIVIAEHSFTLPDPIAGYTSTPWTFIFPVGKYCHEKHYENGTLQIIEATTPSSNK